MIRLGFISKSVLLYVLIWAVFTVSPAQGAQINNITFNEDCIVNNKRLTLRGIGLLKYLVVIKAYVGGFYLEENTSVANRFTDVERRLELHYFHAISSDDFAKATSEIIKKNVPPNQYEKLSPFIKQMNNLYRDVRPGDRYAATYIPGKGTGLALNGNPLGIVPDSEFSEAYFAIWLGKNPINEKFRDTLLGQ